MGSNFAMDQVQYSIVKDGWSINGYVRKAEIRVGEKITEISIRLNLFNYHPDEYKIDHKIICSVPIDLTIVEILAYRKSIPQASAGMQCELICKGTLPFDLCLKTESDS